MPRFFVDIPLATTAGGTLVPLPEAVVRHIHVLRLRQDDTLTLFNGDGHAYDTTLIDIGKKQAVVQLGARRDDNGSEPPYHITLVQGIASNEKMDWLIEKAVELGVDRIVPVSAARSVVRLSGERKQKRHDHWVALSRAACEQCGRNRVPEIVAPLDLDHWLAADATDKTWPGTSTDDGTAPLRLLLSPRATLTFPQMPVSPPTGGVILLIGPEGGWSDDEEAAARAAGYTGLSLGTRVLRTETAGMAILAAFAGRWGGWTTA